MNDNGQRKSESESDESERGYDPQYRPVATRRFKKRWIIIPVILFMFLSTGVLMAVVAFFGIVDIRPVNTVEVKTSVQEITGFAREVALESHSNLVRLDSDHLGLSNKKTFSVEDVSQLHITARQGNIVFVIDDGDNIRVESHVNFDYEFDANTGILKLINRQSKVTIYVPHTTEAPLFEELFLENRQGQISIICENDSNLYLAENLEIQNRQGVVKLQNITVSDNFNINNRQGTIEMKNVVADPDKTDALNFNGNLSVSS